MPNPYGEESVEEILALEERQREDAEAKEALGEAPAPKPEAPQPGRRPPDRR